MVGVRQDKQWFGEELLCPLRGDPGLDVDARIGR